MGHMAVRPRPKPVPREAETLGPYRTPALARVESVAGPVTYRYRRIRRTAWTAEQAKIEFQYRVGGMWWWRSHELFTSAERSYEECEEIVRRWVWLMSREGEG